MEDLPAADNTPGFGRPPTGGRPIDASAAGARRRVGELLLRVGVSLDSVIAADALIVTTELITNAIRHGGGLTLFLPAVTDNALHLSVGDASPRAPFVRPHSPDLPGGHGWPLIQRLSEHISITPRPDGKIIEAVVRLS
ncbi:anti-sigma regulatory factor (Ser/Thr protein kinase) [Streptomyces sp. CG 926]|uniref:ATP-binding protein n=1 Tax=Streptomyces sp. CG 926 TaxID=1882405 RepID=UPI000D7B71C8|nr:ATP-binding protein [Streptomyces sp. CG 926]PWK64371.1 anti-sigma regulatory factor (Ser/Thr protein kinase) [Streptomyces sp. CG 926]